jgi:hypothetical protein
MIYLLLIRMVLLRHMLPFEFECLSWKIFAEIFTFNLILLLYEIKGLEKSPIVFYPVGFLKHLVYF